MQAEKIKKKAMVGFKFVDGIFFEFDLV